jgi:hypothetical protein
MVEACRWALCTHSHVTAAQVVCLPLDAAVAAAALGLQDLEGGLEGARPRVVGWGYTEGDPFAQKKERPDRFQSVAARTLQSVHLPVLSGSECARRYSAYYCIVHTA